MILRTTFCLVGLFSLTTFLSGQVSDLIISEYGEGSSGNNKYIEIYNGTGSTVNLSDYQLWRVSNGGPWPEFTYDFSASTLANGTTIVIANNSSDVPGADEYSGFCSWNGDDAVGLAKDISGNFTLIDAVGEDGSDPGSGWDVAGVSNGTVNHTLARKATVCSPNTDWDASRGTNASNSEWIVTSYSTGAPSSMGNHTDNCGGPQLPEIQLEYPTGTDISCGTETIDFGTTNPSVPVQDVLTIANDGSADLTINSLPISGSGASAYTLVNPPSTPITIPAAGTQDITIQFNPPMVSTYDATLTINNDDADEGSCTIDFTGVGSNAIPIPDNGCGSMNYATSTFNYSGSGGTIDDINVGVSISHAWRNDLVIEIISPEGTIVELLDGATGGNALNLEVLFDEDSGNNLSTNDHTVDMAYDETVISAGAGTLSQFDGENPIGVWTIRICDDNSIDVGSLENWEVFITENCIPTTSISSFAPTSGPEGTQVTISGSGFSGNVTGVQFGSAQSTSFTVVNNTTITAEVPANGSGFITLTENTCSQTSANSFSVLAESGCTNFPAGFTGLLISGVYDESAGSCHYVELFNGSASDIDLTGWQLRSDNNASDPNDPPPANYNGGTFDLSGTIPSGGTYMIRGSGTGSPCNSCSSITPDIEFNSLGYNEGGIDRLLLFDGTSFIDLWAEDQASSSGFTYTRVNGASAPSTSYNQNDWSFGGTADCIGFQLPPEDNPPTSSAISDVSGCAISILFTATPGQGGELSFQWKYNDGSSSTWTDITNGTGTITGGSEVVSGATVKALSITGDVNSLDGYQFYCEISEFNGCSNVTNAVQFTYTSPDPYFRSVQSGNWTDASTWEMSPNGFSGWTTACDFPSASNSDQVNILYGHTITVLSDPDGDPNIEIDNLTIDLGGTLDVQRTAEVSILDGTGVDLTVYGTLIDRGTSGAGLNVFNGTWILGASGTIRKTGRSSTANYRDKYDGGISNIPATANWFNEYDGSDPSVSVVAVGMFYPNLHLISSSGFYDAGSFSGAFTGGANGGFLTIKGNLEVGTSGGGTVKMYYNNMFASSPMVISGDLIIGAGSELTNESYDGSNSCASNRGDGTGFELRGNATINGTLTVKDYNSSDAECANHKRILRFAGSSNQTISGTGSINVLNTEMNNSNGVNLSGIDLEITNSLEFFNGLIQTTNSKIQIENNNPNAILGSNNSRYIDGTLQWGNLVAGNLLTGTNYTFPIGQSGSVGSAPFTISFTSTPPLYLTGFFDSADAVSTDPPIEEICPEGSPLFEYTYDCATGGWTIDPDPGSGDVFTYTITLTDNNVCNGTFYKVIKDGIITEGCPNGQEEQFTSFSTFNLLSGNQQTLPVELLFFDAIPNNNEVFLSWKTASEQNNDFFLLERSKDGRDFEAIAQINGAGTSTLPQNYSYVDEKPFKGVNYYRLRQVDFDGKFEFSNIKSVQIDSRGSSNWKLAPSPTEGSLNILFEDAVPTSGEIIIYDILGHLVHQEIIAEGRELINLSLHHLPSGTYFLRYDGKTERFLKQ